jgi:hypothetical protein
MTLNQAIETAKAASSPRWLRAIDRAAQGLQSGELIVTLLAHDTLVTSPRGSYRVNGSCACEAAKRGHRECYHRAVVRLVEMPESDKSDNPMAAPATIAPRIVRSVERDIITHRRLDAVRRDNWLV